NPGPVVWLTACGHGDEVCGIVIIQEVFRKIRRELLRGAVHAFPLMNPIGFETASRNITMSREDLNRSFPGEATGSLGMRIAHRIFSTIMETSPDLVLDLHNDWTKSIPYALIDRDPGKPYRAAYEKTMACAQRTGFASIVDKDELTSTLSHNLLLSGVPALTLELGEPFVINEVNVEFGLGAIWNVLARLEMTAPRGEPFLYPVPLAYQEGQLLRYSDKPFSSTSGIVRFLAKPGEAVKKGQPFARIVNAFGKHQETARALDDAIVLGHSDCSAVFPGMPIMAFGVIPNEEGRSPS
ncbi:MAG: M14 family metallopeptidase, partial [Planctomycetota bacterium]